MACSLSTQPHRHSSDRQLLQLPHINGSSAMPNCGMRSLVPCVHRANWVRWDDFFFLIEKVMHHCTECRRPFASVTLLLAGFGSLVPVCHSFLSLQNQTFAPVTPQVSWEKQMEGALGGNNKIKQHLGDVEWMNTALRLLEKLFSPCPWKHIRTLWFFHLFLTYEYSKS